MQESDISKVRNFAEYPFDYVCTIEPERDRMGRVIQLMPQTRYRNARGLNLNRYGRGPFCHFQIPRDLNSAGVYAVLVDGALRYIGECVEWSQRSRRGGLSFRFNNGYGN